MIATVGGLFGVGASVAVDQARADYVAGNPLPFYGGYASLLAPDPTNRLATSGRVFWAADVATRDIALTFDDGPHPHWTPKVIAALDRHGVPATFFCKGSNVAAHGGIHQGSRHHELGNHTYTHHDLGRMDYSKARDELERCQDVMHRTYGTPPTLFRPPYGHLGGAALLAAASLGLTTVAWSGQFRESRFHDNPDGLVRDALSQLRPGTILLGHDAGTAERLLAIERLDRFLEQATSAGWTFHTVSSLLVKAT